MIAVSTRCILSRRQARRPVACNCRNEHLPTNQSDVMPITLKEPIRLRDVSNRTWVSVASTTSFHFPGRVSSEWALGALPVGWIA